MATGRCQAIEAGATGLAYGAGLCSASACLVASFRPEELSAPYWSGLPGLRTDTCGIAAFVAVAACFGVSEYLRLRRHQHRPATEHSEYAGGPFSLLVLTASKTVAIIATAVVLYISVNSVTHPVSLGFRATHLVAWPTEGTLRVSALAMVVFTTGTLRYLQVKGLYRYPACPGAGLLEIERV